MRVWDDPHLTNTCHPPVDTEDAERSAVDIPSSTQMEAGAEPTLGKLSVVVINNTQNVRNGVTIALPASSAITSVRAVRTSESENRAALPAVAVSASAFQADFPPRSITSFTWSDPSAPDGGVVTHDRGSSIADGGAGSDGRPGHRRDQGLGLCVCPDGPRWRYVVTVRRRTPGETGTCQRM